MHSQYQPQPAWGYPPQQAAWGGHPQQAQWQMEGDDVPYASPHATPPPPEQPQGRDGFVRLSAHVFVVPEGTATPAAVEELNEVHAMGVTEKSAMVLDPAGWEDDTSFATAINKAFRVKGGKPGPKFWKGVREAVMKLCGVQDLLLLIPAPAEPPAEQTQTLLKTLLAAADTKAVADQLVGLKSGKVVAVLLGWDAEEVRQWPLIGEDPIPAPPSREELARRHDPDDLSQYYMQSNRQAPPRQVPPRQRQQQAWAAGPQQRWSNGMSNMGQGHYGGNRGWNEQQQQQQQWNGGQGGYGDGQGQQWNGAQYGGYGAGGGQHNGGYGNYGGMPNQMMGQPTGGMMPNINGGYGGGGQQQHNGYGGGYGGGGDMGGGDGGFMAD